MKLFLLFAKCFEYYEIRNYTLVLTTYSKNCILTEGDFIRVMVTQDETTLLDSYRKCTTAKPLFFYLPADFDRKKLSVLVYFYNLKENVASTASKHNGIAIIILSTFLAVAVFSALYTAASELAYRRIMRPRAELPK